MTKRVLYRKTIAGVPVELERVPRASALCLKVGDEEEGTAVMSPAEALAFAEAMKDWATSQSRTSEGVEPQAPTTAPRGGACLGCGRTILSSERYWGDRCNTCHDKRVAEGGDDAM